MELTLLSHSNNKNNNNKNNNSNNKNPHLNFSKGTILEDKKQGVGIRDKGPFIYYVIQVGGRGRGKQKHDTL